MQDVKARKDTVKPVERACLHLIVVHGWSHREVGQVFGFSPEMAARLRQSAEAKGETVRQAA